MPQTRDVLLRMHQPQGLPIALHRTALAAAHSTSSLVHGGHIGLGRDVILRPRSHLDHHLLAFLGGLGVQFGYGSLVELGGDEYDYQLRFNFGARMKSLVS